VDPWISPTLQHDLAVPEFDSRAITWIEWVFRDIRAGGVLEGRYGFARMTGVRNLVASTIAMVWR
jgi:hypothetical protein